MSFGTKLGHLVAGKQNAILVEAMYRIKEMVDTSKGSEALTCLVLQDYVVAVLREAGVTPANEGQNGRKRR